MPRVPVIGIAGGVGSGKSSFARALAAHGALVSDSDAATRDALTRPDVIDTLTAWWGDDILDDDAIDRTVDRRKVAAIVFADKAQLQRLEALLHPYAHQARRDLLDRARREGAPAMVIDAPLLFEAGLDAECDLIVFIDVPREIRLERVRQTRGWDEHELDRRERAQLPLDQKRARSGMVVDNAEADAPLADEALAAIQTARRAISGHDSA